MIYKRAMAVSLAVFLFITVASAQRAEVTISLNEAFFDSLLDSVFQNFDPPEFSMASTELYRSDAEMRIGNGWGSSFSVSPDSGSMRLSGESQLCNESVKILREMKGVRTAVKFRDGKIYVPLAFSGNYNPPLIGCVEFAGWAEANIDLEFDQNSQKLVGRVRVYNVNLNGMGGIGGSVIARLIQGSIDKKMNPIEIMSLDKVSFGFPIQSSGTLRMKAQKIKPEVAAGALNVRVEYEFVKG